MPTAFTLPGPAERRRLLDRLLRPAPEAARALLGQVLVRRLGRRVVRARIVEAEAYLPARDPAAHVFRGRTKRVAPLFGPAGNVYVYFVYGMHHCLNLAVDREGVPGCVLIRAVELLDGEDPGDGRGPGRLCRALGLTVRDSGQNLFAKGTRLTLREGKEPRRVGRTRRVGINVAADRVLRFFDAESPVVSGPRTRGERSAWVGRARARAAPGVSCNGEWLVAFGPAGSRHREGRRGRLYHPAPLRHRRVP